MNTTTTNATHDPNTCSFFLTDFERCMKNTTRREHIKKHVEKHTVYPATHNRKCKLLYNTYAKCFNGGDVGGGAVI